MLIVRRTGQPNAITLLSLAAETAPEGHRNHDGAGDSPDPVHTGSA